MSRVLIILMFVYGLLLASAGVGICIHAAAVGSVTAEHFLHYMITGWVCLGVGLVLSLSSIKAAQQREQRFLLKSSETTGKRPVSGPLTADLPDESPSVSFPQRTARE